MITRRSLLIGMVASPAILKLGLYMPVKSIKPTTLRFTIDPSMNDRIFYQAQRVVFDLAINGGPLIYNDQRFIRSVLP